jgi:hypothetical protein
MSGILLSHGGFPFSVLSGVDSNEDGPANDRANLVGDPNTGSCGGIPVHTRGCRFNPSAFAAPTLGTDGNSGRNLLRGPGYVDVDFALVKSFGLHFGPFAESQKIDFRLEAFNLFNHPNFLSPVASLGLPTTIGQIQAAYTSNPIGGSGGPRVLQVALKYVF